MGITSHSKENYKRYISCDPLLSDGNDKERLLSSYTRSLDAHDEDNIFIHPPLHNGSAENKGKESH